MFGAPAARRGTDAPMRTAGMMLAAMLDGKTPSQAEDLGAKMELLSIMVDSLFFVDPFDGPAASHRSMLLPIAAAKHGNHGFLRGLVSQPDFFAATVPHASVSDRLEHSSELVSIACTFELLARCDMEGLAILDAGAAARRKLIEAQAEPARKDRETLYSLDSFSEISSYSRGRDMMISGIALASSASPEQRSEALSWIQEHSPAQAHEKLGPSGVPADLLDKWGAAAFASGISQSMLSALALGYPPSQTDALKAAESGCFEVAASIYKGLSKADPSGPAPAPLAMSGNLANCLGPIAEGYWEERKKITPSEWRESTWGNYFGHREHIHQGALLAMAGSLDSRFDKPAALVEGKQRLASIIRALSSLSLPGLAPVSYAEIEALAPNAPPTSDELIFLGTIGSKNLAERLDQTPIEEPIADSFCSAMIKAHAAAADPDGRQRPRSGAADLRRAEIAKEKLEHLENALFECSQRSSSLLSSAMRDKLGETLQAQGLSVRFETKALDMASAGSTRRRAPLKA